MNYKVLDIDDRKGPDQFKIGDRVRVYGEIPRDFEVYNVSGPWISSARQSYYWQQCRLLIQVKEKETTCSKA